MAEENKTHKNTHELANNVLYLLFVTDLNFIAYFGYRLIVDELHIDDNGYLVSFFMASYVVMLGVIIVKESHKFFSNVKESLVECLLFIYFLPAASFFCADMFMLIYFPIREIVSEYGFNLFKVILIFLYLLPSFISYTRQHPSRLAIAFANILLGWTVIVWIITLIWSGTAIKKVE